nr:unnamed protein product [Callosobruchus chinensis]
MFSSGTTGLPKGICLNHYALLKQSGSHREECLEVEYPETCDTVILLYSTLYWISSVSTLIGATLKGEARVLCRNFDAKRFWEILEKYKVTFTFLPPYYLPTILHERPRETDVRSLKTLLTGSSHVSAQVMQETIDAFPDAVVKNGYGQTEIAGFASLFNRPEQRILQKKKLTSCGKIFRTVQWKIVDLETEQPVTGPNKKGELRLKTDLHMNGYYKMDSSDAFDSEGYLRTGDLAYYDEDNCLFIDDRIKEMFKYRGWHILPAILEDVLMGHPAVKEAAVIGIPHPEDGDHPMGLVVLKKGYENVTPEEIRKFADEKLSDAQKLRAGLRIVDEFVRTATGKYEDETGHVDTYGTLLTRCVRAAIKLRELGIGEDDIVSTCSHNHRNSCVPFVASTFIGAIPATFDPDLPQIDTISLLSYVTVWTKLIYIALAQRSIERFRNIYRKSAGETSPHCCIWGRSGKYMKFDDFLEPKVNERQFKVYETSNPKKTAVIVFSSGTTGLPKGICLNHYTLLKMSGWFKRDSPGDPATSDNVMLLYSTFYWISRVTSSIGAALKGEAHVICRKFDARTFLEIVEKYKVPYFTASAFV